MTSYSSYFVSKLSVCLSSSSFISLSEKQQGVDQSETPGPR